MRVMQLPDGTPVYHDIGESLVPVASLLLRDRPAIAALGPLYAEDPAAELLAPFRRTAEATGWTAAKSLAPVWVWERARELRRERAASNIDLLFERSTRDLVDWTRAGLVLGYARHRGIRVKGRETIHVPWRLRGTVTGRFGTDPVRGEGWTFNPLSLGPDDRWRIVPRSAGRRIAVLDFKAMDLCSMVSLVPGLARRYDNTAPRAAQTWDGTEVPLPDDVPAADMHAVTVRLLFGHDYSLHDFQDIRSLVKEQVFVHAYGGQSSLRREFERALPELDFLRRMEQGEAGRLVQTQSALAFRAALSRALPLLTGDDVCPLFTVHDELALDYSEGASEAVGAVAGAMEGGASSRIGVPYRVGLSTGASYEEAKNG